MSKRDGQKTGSGKTAGKGGASPARGDLKIRVKTARGRSVSSQAWLKRQLNDPYVAAAKEAGYRSRAAYKLTELDDKFHFLKPGKRVLELGAAPGAWTQVNIARVKGGKVVAIDINPMEPIAGATVLQLDAESPEADDILFEAVGGKVDVIESDMASPATGHRATDHIRIIALVEAAFSFAERMLAPGGAFVAKMLRGGGEHEFLALLKRRFETVRTVKPGASRADSSEIFIVCLGYRPTPESPESPTPSS